MINGIWLFFIIIGIAVSIVNGTIDTITDAAIEYAKLSVEIAIGLVGTMALWLGLMRIAQEAGIIQGLGKLIQPLLKKIFPEIPDNHPAMGSITANLAANFFGLGNAATPLGIKAMQDLQTLNNEKDKATNSMVMFLGINTSSVTLISSSVVAYRAAANSSNPAEIIAPTIIATSISTLTAVLAAMFFQKMSIFKN